MTTVATGDRLVTGTNNNTSPGGDVIHWGDWLGYDAELGRQADELMRRIRGTRRRKPRAHRTIDGVAWALQGDAELRAEALIARLADVDSRRMRPREPTAAELLCTEHDPEAWYPAPTQHETWPLKLCAECPARRRCLAAALGADERHGTWGGTTATARGAAREWLSRKRRRRQDARTRRAK